MIGSVVVLAGPTNGTGQGFGMLACLVVVAIVLAGAAGFASGSSWFVVVLAGAAILTGTGFRGLSNLIVVGIVLACTTWFTTCLPNLLVVFSSST